MEFVKQHGVEVALIVLGVIALDKWLGLTDGIVGAVAKK